MRIKTYLSIAFLSSYGNGLMIPVMTLAFISHSITLGQVALLFAIYSLTAVLCEIPSGVSADLLGRKKVFLSAQLLNAGGMIVFAFGSGFSWLALTCILLGSGKACTSGAFDALCMDEYCRIHGSEKITVITRMLFSMDTIGLSVGALTGGIMAQLNPHNYDLNIWGRFALCLFTAFLILIAVRESEISTCSPKLLEYLRDSWQTIVQNSTLIVIFVGAWTIGIFLASIETYWQPRFMSLFPDSGWLLGVLSCLAFGASLFSTLLVDRINAFFENHYEFIYTIARMLTAVILIALTFIQGIMLFIICYALVYFFFGLSNISESVLVFKNSSSDKRASILSVQSLTIQLGFMCASFLYGFLIEQIGISGVWVLSAFALISSTVFSAIRLLIKKN